MLLPAPGADSRPILLSRSETALTSPGPSEEAAVLPHPTLGFLCTTCSRFLPSSLPVSSFSFSEKLLLLLPEVKIVACSSEREVKIIPYSSFLFTFVWIFSNCSGSRSKSQSLTGRTVYMTGNGLTPMFAVSKVLGRGWSWQSSFLLGSRIPRHDPCTCAPSPTR